MKDNIKDKLLDLIKGKKQKHPETSEEKYVVNDIPDTLCIDYLKDTIAFVIADITDAELKKETEKLAERIKYSDPVSNESVKEVEKKLIAVSEEFINLIYSGKTEEAKRKINEIKFSLGIRNTMVKQGK